MLTRTRKATVSAVAFAALILAAGGAAVEIQAAPGQTAVSLPTPNSPESPTVQEMSTDVNPLPWASLASSQGPRRAVSLFGIATPFPEAVSLMEESVLYEVTAWSVGSWGILPFPFAAVPPLQD